MAIIKNNKEFDTTAALFLAYAVLFAVIIVVFVLEIKSDETGKYLSPEVLHLMVVSAFAATMAIQNYHFTKKLTDHNGNGNGNNNNHQKRDRKDDPLVDDPLAD